MFWNYFLIAIRILSRSKTYSFINIFGLALGVSCCLLLSLYIQDELRYDTHHNRLNDLYRVTTHFDVPRHGFDKITTVSPPIAPTAKNEVPEIEAAARLFPLKTALFKYQGKSLYEYGGFTADSTIFDVLTYEFIEGDPTTALAEANTVVLTETLSKKLFGNASGLHKTLVINQNESDIHFKVTGIVKDVERTHIPVNYFIAITSEGDASYFRSEPVNNEWAGMQFVTAYVKLVPNHNKDHVVKKMNDVLQRHGEEDMKALGFTKKLDLQPVKDIYLKSDVQQNPRIVYLYVTASIACFILLIGCINFMNLATARATKRASEFGVRKVMGAHRGAIMKQIFGEALLNVLISVLLSIAVIQLTLPLFNDFIGRNISFIGQNLGYTILSLLAITTFTGVAAGVYPAFYFSMFQPAQVLKAKFTVGNASGLFRRSLVVFQFTIAIILVCGVIVVSRQLKFLREKDLGFDPEAKIVLPLRTGTARSHYQALQNYLAGQHYIKAVSGALYVPGSTIIRDMPFYIQGEDMSKSVAHKRNLVDYNFQDLLGIKLIAGRSFTSDRQLESQNKVVINRKSAESLGLDIHAAVGQKIYSVWQGKESAFEIVGVMENYHQTTLKEEILPTLFEIPANANEYDYLIATVSTKDFHRSIAAIERTFKSYIHDTPFEYSFLDESIQNQYKDDRNVFRIIISFTVIALLISCLGLYGLSSYMAERRIKEISVRKVMGASVRQIVSMMSTEFVKLVFIAFVIAIPFAWYAMNAWLKRFAYKTSIDTTIFIYAGSIALLIAVLAVSFESVKAATTNPAEALKNE